MTPTIAIMSSDSNPLYLDFWPIVSRIWKQKLNIQPVLVYVDDKDVEIDHTYGTVVKLQPVEGIPIYLQNQWVRLFWTQMYKDEVCISSDIDMLPMSNWYFKDQLKDVEDDKYVHINPCLETYHNLYPICYHVAKGSTFKEVLNLDDDFETSINKLFEAKLGYDPGNGRSEWFADERFSTARINEYKEKNNQKLVPLRRPNGQNGYRIDRIAWGYEPKLVKEDYYFDCHSVRPYKEHKDEIDKLVKLILNV